MLTGTRGKKCLVTHMHIAQPWDEHTDRVAHLQCPCWGGEGKTVYFLVLRPIEYAQSCLPCCVCSGVPTLPINLTLWRHQRFLNHLSQLKKFYKYKTSMVQKLITEVVVHDLVSGSKRLFHSGVPLSEGKCLSGHRGISSCNTVSRHWEKLEAKPSLSSYPVIWCIRWQKM